MNINNLPIPPRPIHNRSNNNKLISAHKVPYTPLVLARVRVGVQVELERRREREQAEEEEEVEDGEGAAGFPRAGDGPHLRGNGAGMRETNWCALWRGAATSCWCDVMPRILIGGGTAEGCSGSILRRSWSGVSLRTRSLNIES